MRGTRASVIWRAAAVVGVATLLTASVKWTPAHSEAVPLTPAVTPPVFTDFAALASGLRERLAALRSSEAGAASPPHVARNPLGFLRLPVPETHARLRVEDARGPDQARTAPPAEPELTLLGIAESRDGEVVRTAIISGAGDELHLVRERDALVGRYAVRLIEEGAVFLDDTRGGVRRLTLAGFSGIASPNVE